MERPVKLTRVSSVGSAFVVESEADETVVEVGVIDG
jgi:hypothetical protein